MTHAAKSMSSRVCTSLLVAAAAFALGSCSDGSVTPIVVASIDLSPPTSIVRAGSTVTLTARPLDADGHVVDVRPILWSSSNKTVAVVSSGGVVTALTAGETRIAASALGKSAVASLTVTPRVVAVVVVSPSSVNMRVGVSAPLQAQTLDAEGAVLTGRTVVWTSSNVGVATVNAQGVVTGVSAGAATITAASEGRTDQVAVTVTLPPVQTVVVAPSVDTLGVDTDRLHTATLRDVAGSTLSGRAVAWSSSNLSVATVSSTGVVTGRSPGTAVITATSEGRVGSSTVIVLARLAGAVTVTPSSSTLVLSATQQLVAQVTDSLGNLLVGRLVTFRSDQPFVASVSATGLVTAVAPGTARITATAEGRSGSATILVILEPVVSVSITPSIVALFVAATQQLTVTARSENGTLLTGRSATWTTGAPNVVSVSATGLVTALAPGVGLILGTVDGVTAASTVTVSVPAVASVLLSPTEPSIAVAGSIQLTAAARDAGGAVLTGRTTTWSSSAESIAFVSSTGLVVGFKTGTARITATSEGVSASTVVTVR